MNIDFAKLFNVEEFRIDIDITGKYYKPIVKQGKFIWNEPTYHEYPLSIATWTVKGKRFQMVVPYEPEIDMLGYIQQAIELSRG